MTLRALHGNDAYFFLDIELRRGTTKVQMHDMMNEIAGKPKGVLHTTGGYMVMAATTTRYIFDLQPGDVWWCTADPGPRCLVKPALKGICSAAC